MEYPSTLNHIDYFDTMSEIQLNYLSWNSSGKNTNDPIILLHGLFASSRIWTNHGKELAEHGYSTYALDFRNHGESFHSREHSIELMSDDILRWMKYKHIENPVLVGHSMGGLVAAHTALSHPYRIRAIVVIDIAPRSYTTDHELEFRALQLDLTSYKTRKELDRDMAKIHPSQKIRQFLQMSLKRNEDGFRWKMNVDALRKSAYLSKYVPTGTFKGPALFIRGSQSDYVQEEDYPLIKKYFPSARIETIEGADHWIHHTYRSQLIDEILLFCKNI